MPSERTVVKEENSSTIMFGQRKAAASSVEPSTIWDVYTGGTPFYRLYNANILDHFYTTSAPERNNANINLGYALEGVAAYPN